MQRLLPDVEWDQLTVSLPADDDGLWFFWRRGRKGMDVQIESPSGLCPFLIEASQDDERRWGSTPAETVEVIASLLR